jgi:phosphate transport system protein
MLRHFDEELKVLKERLVFMGSLAEKMIHLAIRELAERKEAYAEEVFQVEKEVNDMHLEIDERVLRLLALRQPVAADLRLLVMASKIGGELERIADQAVNICQNAHFLLKYPELKPLIDLPIMAQTTQTMIRDSLDSFVRGEVELARKVLEIDDKIDGLKDQIFRELLTYMMSDPRTIQRALALILIARNLERVGDHATNIAEEVIYLIQGREVRHHHEEHERMKSQQ